MAYHLYVSGVENPRAATFVEGVQFGTANVRVKGGNTTPAMQALGQRAFEGSFRNDWQKTTGSTDSGMQWLFGDAN
jgi:hypothetical protein